jgi:hypothetical protein
VSLLGAALAASLYGGAAWAQQPAAGAGSGEATSAPLAALVRRVEQFRNNHLTQGTARQLGSQVERMQSELERVAAQAEALIATGGETAIAAHVLRGEAHEHLAYEMSQQGQLMALDRDEQARFAALEAAVARLDGLIAHDDLTAAQREQLRLRAQEARDRLQQARAERATRVQEPFNAQVREERLRALRRYAIAVAMAEHEHVNTPFSSHALSRLRLEDYQDLLEPAINGIPAQLRQSHGLAFRAGMYGAPLPHNTAATSP